MRHLDLFSGIGGFALAVEEVWPEAEHTFCDIEPFAQAILKKHWPNSPLHGDIKQLNPEPADLVTGGFPCQPFSAAGKRKGTEDDRHLWPEMLRVIRASTPKWVVGENVGGLLTWDKGLVLDTVLSDLESAGYEAWPFVLPALALNAPHRRDRVWIVAHSKSAGRVPLGAQLEGQGRQAATLDAGGNTTDTAGKQTHAAESGGLYPQSGLQDRGAWQELDSDSDSQQRHEGSQSKHNEPQGGQICADERHNRDRVRRPTRKRNSGSKQDNADTDREGRERDGQAWAQIAGFPRLSSRKGDPQRGDGWGADWPQVATELCALDDGLPTGLARPRGWRNAALKGAGNAIVPQVAAEILKAIKAIDPDMGG